MPAASAPPSVLLLARPGLVSDELFADLAGREDLCLVRVATAVAASRTIDEMPVALVVACPDTPASEIDAMLDALARARRRTPVLAIRTRQASEPASWGRAGVAILRMPLLAGVLSRSIDVVLGMNPEEGSEERMQLTARDAARLLGVSEATLYRWVKSGDLAATRVNEQYRLNRIDLLEFAASRNMDISLDLLAELEQPQLPSLAEAIRAGGVHRGISGNDKASILRAVVERLPLPRPADRELLHRVLLAREALGSTGFGNGIAIPHPRNPIVLRVPTPKVAICYLERPVDFDALDGKAVHTLVTVVSPSTRAHLHLLALIAASVRDPAVLARLEARAGADELVPEIERVESAIAARRAAAAEPSRGAEGTER